jgi:hypothetical protein
VGALAWTDAGQLSGTLAGEYDGLLRPPLTAHAGWVGRHDALLGGVSVVQIDTARFSSTTSLLAVGGVRLSLDYRRYLWARESGAVNLYGDGGLYGIVPNAADADTAYTEAEQADATEGADANRARVAGFGGQAGLGAEYLFGDATGRPAVAVGLRYLARIYRGQQGDEDQITVSTIVTSEAAVVLEFTR